MPFFRVLAGGAFDHLNCQHIGYFDQNVSKKSNVCSFLGRVCVCVCVCVCGGGGGVVLGWAWAVLELTKNIIYDPQHSTQL